MKYPMSKKTENPLFNYITKLNDSFDYYLFESFDEALKKVVELSHGGESSLIYEICFDATTREFFAWNTFTAYNNKVKYDKHKKISLHIQFYVNAGKWLNPNQEWIEKLKRNDAK